MATGVEVTLPKRFPARALSQGVQDMVDNQLLDLALEFQKNMQYYPPWQPWKNPPPKSGPRAGGARTGNYGRGWGIVTDVKAGGRNSISILNDVTYARYVGGPHGVQANALASRGWPSLEDVAVDTLAEQIAKGRFTLDAKFMGFA